jgi:hypothetical protein
LQTYHFTPRLQAIKYERENKLFLPHYCQGGYNALLADSGPAYWRVSGAPAKYLKAPVVTAANRVLKKKSGRGETRRS